jgi:formylmethanofuran dehydrogenase subunit C
MIQRINTLVRAEDLFSGLDPEDEGESDREFQKENSSVLEQLVEEFERSMKSNKAGIDYFSLGINPYKIPDITNEDIQDFCDYACSYGQETSAYIGVYASFLINKSKEKVIRLDLRNYEFRLDKIGSSNCLKSIIIQGDVGDDVGEGMESGNIIVNGNAGGEVGGFMIGGSILIKGNVRERLGYYMKNGKIVVLGDSGDKTGLSMEDGRIFVKGNSGKNTGGCMNDGYIHLKGNSGDYTGNGMYGGSIRIDGNAGENVASCQGKGKIYINGEFISIGYSPRGSVYLKGRPMILNGRRVEE